MCNIQACPAFDPPACMHSTLPAGVSCCQHWQLHYRACNVGRCLSGTSDSTCDFTHGPTHVGGHMVLPCVLLPCAGLGACMGPAAALLALLCVGPIAAVLAADQQIGSTCRWSSQQAAEQQQCPVGLWYSTLQESCPAQTADTHAAVGQVVAAAQQLGKHSRTQHDSRKMQNESVFMSASGMQGSTPAVVDRQVYIVRFKQYRMLSDLREVLETVSSTLTSMCRVLRASASFAQDSSTCRAASRSRHDCIQAWTGLRGQ